MRISLKINQLGETTLFDAEKGSFPKAPFREKANFHPKIPDTLPVVVVSI